jgi:hypothetical protein
LTGQGTSRLAEIYNSRKQTETRRATQFLKQVAHAFATVDSTLGFGLDCCEQLFPSVDCPPAVEGLDVHPSHIWDDGKHPHEMDFVVRIDVTNSHLRATVTTPGVLPLEEGNVAISSDAIQPHRVSAIDGMGVDVGVEVHACFVPDGIAADEATEGGGLVAIAVLHQVAFQVEPSASSTAQAP